MLLSEARRSHLQRTLQHNRPFSLQFVKDLDNTDSFRNFINRQRELLRMNNKKLVIRNIKLVKKNLKFRETVNEDDWEKVDAYFEKIADFEKKHNLKE